MVTGVCPRCGNEARLQGHHPTGRADGVPYHRDLVDTICVDCHLAEHQVWRGAGLDMVDGPATFVSRLAIWLGRYGRALPPDMVLTLAVVLADVAERCRKSRHGR
jgi:hypothetical protein